MNVSYKELILFSVLAVLCAIILSFSHELSKERISENIDIFGKSTNRTEERNE